MKRLGRIVAVLALGLAGLFSSCAKSSSGATGAMYIDSCTLGCTNGSTGQQVSCGVINTFQNQEIGVLFSKSVQFSSVSKQSFQVIDTVTGTVPPGTYLLDPTNNHRVIFRPQLSFDAQGNPVFGFRAGASYEIRIPGTKQGDAPPFIRSTGGTENSSRLLCTITTDQGISDPVPGPPIVTVFVDTVDPQTGAITTGVVANGATNVSLNTKVTLVFNDLMSIGTIVIPGTGNSPITVKIDPDGNVANTGDQVAVQGVWTFNLDQIALQTTLVFTPSQPFPSAGANLASPRQIVVDVPNTVKDLKGNALFNPGPVQFTPQFIAFPPLTIPTGGEQFTDLANCDQNRSGANWGETIPGLLTPGLGGGSGRLGDLHVAAGETVTLHSGPTHATGFVQFIASGPLDGDIIDINGVQYFIVDGIGPGVPFFVELEGDYATLTLTNLVHQLNASTDPLVNVATYSLDGPSKLLIEYDTPGDTGLSFTFDVYRDVFGVPTPSPSVAFISGPTVQGGTAHLLEGWSFETFAAGNLLDNFDFQAFPGTMPPPINVVDGAFEFATLLVENGGTLRLEGPNAGRLLVRGKATVSGVIDASGETQPPHESDSPRGQLGGTGGPNAGDGGDGAERPDNTGSNLLASGFTEPFRPWNFGIINPGAFIQGRAGVGVGRVGTIGAGPAGVQWPTLFPTQNNALGQLQTNPICESEQVGGAGAGAAYSLNGGIGDAVAVTPVSSQGGSNTPPDTSGGDAGAVGLEPANGPHNKRKLAPEKGHLRGGAGGGGGGATVNQTRTNGNGNPDPCVGAGALINRYRSHSAGAGGGGGGGLQLQAGRTVTLGGTLDASGGDGGSADPTGGPFGVISATQAAPGGAGSGGAILLQARQLLLSAVPGRLSIAGGLGGLGSTGSTGGFGSPGLMRAEALVAPSAGAVAPILDPIDPLDPNSTNYLSVGAWARSRFLPASFQGAQSCWMRPTGSFFALGFNDDAPNVPGWDMDLTLNFGAGNVVVPYRGPNGILPAGQTYEEFWGQLLDRDLLPGEVGAPLVVRFQGAKLAGAMPDPCNVANTGPTSPLAVDSLTPWVRHPSELNFFPQPCDMIRFVIIFDASKLDFLNIVGVSNVRINATPN